jgi:tetratricopeptide (TPR) repeat protein
MNPGYVFFEGNNPLSSGRSAVYPPIVGELKEEIQEHPDNPHLTYKLLASRESGRPLGPEEANEYWRSKAFGYVADHPGRFLVRLGTKLHAIVQNYRIHDLIPARRFDERLGRSHVPAVPFALVAALALVGLVTSAREWRRLLPITCTLATALLVMLVMYVSERHRLAALPALAVFAALGLERLAGWSVPARVAAAGGVVTLASLLMVPTYRAREDTHLWTAHALSNQARDSAFLLRDRGMPRDAGAAASRSFAAAPWLEDQVRPAGSSFTPEGFRASGPNVARPAGENPSLRLDRAQLLLAAGRLDEAERLLRGLIEEGHRFDRGFVQSSQPAYYLARVSLARGDREGAERLLQEALARAPGDPFVLAGLAALTGEARYRGLIVRYFGTAHAAFLTALFQLGTADRQDVQAFTEAARGFMETARHVPELRRARIYLAAALAAAGDVEQAAERYMEATAQRQEPVLAEDWILRAFAQRADEHPGDAEISYQYGVVLTRFGRFEQALEVLRRAWQIEPRPEWATAIAHAERLRVAPR